MPDLPNVILDTNVFVAAGFNGRSASARIIEAVRSAHLRLVWDEATRGESEHIVRKIPRLAWERFADLFRAEERFAGATHPDHFNYITDPDDRKFAALAAATGATLISNDAHLLQQRAHLAAPALTPGEFWRKHGNAT